MQTKNMPVAKENSVQLLICTASLNISKPYWYTLYSGCGLGRTLKSCNVLNGRNCFNMYFIYGIFFKGDVGYPGELGYDGHMGDRGERGTPGKPGFVGSKGDPGNLFVFYKVRGQGKELMLLKFKLAYTFNHFEFPPRPENRTYQISTYQIRKRLLL